MRPLLPVLLLGLASLAACAPEPPVSWQEGGTPLVIPEARWTRTEADPVAIAADGTLSSDGDPFGVVDRVGRLADEDAEPLAVLLPDGRLAGTDRRLLGRIGASASALPGATTAWVSILPDGRVVRYGLEGEAIDEGVWQGCEGPKLRTCLLVSHWVLLREHYRPAHPSSGVTFGVGIGVGF